MAKKDKAVYAPGELTRVREKLGDINEAEAKRIAQLLGGEVGVEKTETKAPPQSSPRTRSQPPNGAVNGKAGGRTGGRQPMRRVEVASDEEDDAARRKIFVPRKADPADDPALPLKLSYRERVKMDRYAGQSEFEIKSAGQVFRSIISFFGEVPDYVSPAFINRRMNEYYKRIELLVTSTRNLLPRNNLGRNERLKKTSPFAAAVLDTIRYWNIERISEDLTKIQGRPRNTKSGEFADILRAIYKPLFMLEQLDYESHIKETYKLLYKILFIENPAEAKSKNQELIRSALSSYSLIRRDVRFLLYPLLMKLLSDQWMPYETFFLNRRRRLMAFLNVTEENALTPAMAVIPAIEKFENTEEEAENGEAGEDEDEESEEEKARKTAMDSERKAVDLGLKTLETLFPQAGWDRLDTFPDLYPYFQDVFNLKREYALIAPTDPLLQAGILMRILEELFFGLRYVSFGSIMGADGGPERMDDVLVKIINNWRMDVEASLDKEYLPRLSEYCRILESSAESRTSSYAKRLLNELYWAKRLYFFPYFKFESAFPPPFQKNDIIALYPLIRQLRKYLTAVAAGIEQGNKQGGAEKKVPCDGIDNPWESYVFQVPNPLSLRLDALLGSKKKNNASLVFFALSVTAVLDYIVNNENSWAYAADRPGPLFRSVDGDGVRPLSGVDIKIDAEGIFKQVMKQREHKDDDP
jgi:hypothetical protein